ncbi:hypothetical protein BVRB_4g088150 [Beta vulgaris subsp. vulgaris]|nr:hypothetical protein BVRB_4g088150 [Beta vulgaris subsp. vulgaris]
MRFACLSHQSSLVKGTPFCNPAKPPFSFFLGLPTLS